VVVSARNELVDSLELCRDRDAVEDASEQETAWLRRKYKDRGGGRSNLLLEEMEVVLSLFSRVC